jgi:hypothetical protein
MSACNHATKIVCQQQLDDGGKPDLLSLITSVATEPSIYPIEEKRFPYPTHYN